MKNLFFILILIISSQVLAEGPGGSHSGGPQRASDGAQAEVVGEVFKRITSSNRRMLNTNRQDKVLTNPISGNESCEELDDGVCDVIATGPLDHLKFGISFMKFRSQESQKVSLGPKNCECLKKKLQGTKTDDEFIEAKKKEREAVNEKILKSYGKKFVNQFASNLEDMSFFLNQSSEMFSNQGTGIDLQCMDAYRFSNKVQDTCKKKNINDQDFIERRKDMFINAISGENTPFQYKMPAMANDILSASKNSDFDSRNVGAALNGNTSMLSRFQYDQMRMDLAIRDPQAKFMDKLIGGILKHPDFSEQIRKDVGLGLSPVEAFLNVVGRNLESTNYFAGMVDGAFARTYLANASALEDSFKFIMMVHPGVGIALSEKKAFDNVRKVIKPGSTDTFIDTLNNYKNVLEPVLIDRCNNMMEEFATAVCTKDDDVIASVDSDDLELLLYNTQEKASMAPFQRGTHLHELLVCEARVLREKVISATVFAGVGVKIDGGSIRDSDYIAKSSTTGNGRAASKSMLSQFNEAASLSEAARKEMGEMIDRNNETRKGFRGPGIAVNRVYAEEVVKGNVMKLGNSGMTKDEAKKYIADSSKFEAKRSAEIANTSSVPKPASSQVASNAVADMSQPGTQSSQASAQPQNFAAPQTNTMIAPNYSSTQTSYSKQAEQSREMLRQYLSEKNDEAEATKAVTALDDSSAQELNRLRNERQSLLQKQLKDGEARLKELQSELSEASTKVPASLVGRKMASVDEEDDVSDDGRSSGRNPRSIDQRASIGGGFKSGPLAASSSGGASTGSSSSGSSGSSNKVSKVAAETETQVSASTNAQGDSGSIVITSSDVKSSGTLPSQELNQEVQKYLADSDLSSTSIQDIKSKGIKIRFNVMENNKLVQKEVIVKYENLDVATRNQIDFKLARKNVQNQVSKLSVLRMLIKQNKPL